MVLFPLALICCYLLLVPTINSNRSPKHELSGVAYGHDHPSKRIFLDSCPAAEWNAHGYVPPTGAQRIGGLKSSQPDGLSSSPGHGPLSALTCPKNEYQYERLKPGELRLLWLEPDHYATDDVHFTLHTFPETDMPRYEALSYTWGSMLSSKLEVQANGKSFPVSQNLRAALKALRRKAEPQLLWIDAVCIYPDRSRTKCCRNLRSVPQSSEEFGFRIYPDMGLARSLP